MLTMLRQRRWLVKISVFVGVTFFLLVLVAIKIPTAFSNFWAEDGTFYQQALSDTFPKDFFSSGGGYIIFISKIIARVVTLGPVTYAPFVNEVVVTIFLSFFIQRLYVNSSFLVKSKIYKFIISISVFLLPINNFDVVASGGALHFQLIFISLIILLAAKKRNAIYKLDVFVVSIAILSDPFALITLIPLFINRRNEVMRFWKNAIGALIFISISTVTQIAMMIIFSLQGNRPIGDGHSIIKTSFLYLDRVIGSTIIPHWGNVSSDSLHQGEITTQLVIRAVIGFICVGVIMFFTIAHLRKRFPNGDIHAKSILVWLLFLPSLYWLTVGLIFNPEPRYAIFPGLCFLFAILILFDHSSCEGKSQTIVNVSSYLVLIFSILIWALSATPSDRRILGPDWPSQISKGKLECSQIGASSIWVKILPIDADWKVELQCQSLVK